jgi:DDE_Tnp_1-associated
MRLDVVFEPEKSRLRALFDHFSVIEDPREPWRVAHPLSEVLLLVVCGTIADCDDYEGIGLGARRIFHSCGGFCRIIMAFPALAG